MGVPSKRPGRSARCTTGIIKSLKDGSSQNFASRLEADLLTHANADPVVSSFRVQPVRIPYVMEDGTPSRYTPDLMVEFVDGRVPCLYEVKFRRELWEIWPEYRRRIKAARLYAKAHGWDFHLLTDYEIRTPFFEAIKHLTPYLRRVIPKEQRARLLEVLAQKGECSVQDLIAEALPGVAPAESAVAIRHLIATREIWADLSSLKKIKPKTLVKHSTGLDPAFCWGANGSGPALRVRRVNEPTLLPVKGLVGPVRYSLAPCEKVSANGRPGLVIALCSISSTWVQIIETGKHELVANNLLSCPQETPANKLQPVADWEAIAPDKLKVAEQRYQAMRPLLQGNSSAAEVNKAAETLGVGRATIYRYLARYHESRMLTALLPGASSGGRGKVRLDPPQDALITEAINGYYLTTQKPSVAETCREIRKMANATGIEAPHDKTVYHRIDLIPDFVKISKRESHREAVEQYGVIRGHNPNTDRPYGMIQIDHTPMDLLLVDPETGLIIGRPYLTIAIDNFSRMVVGYYISLDPPGNAAVGICLSHAILPKDRYLQKFNIKSEWPCRGFMSNIMADNAGEFSNEYMINLCNQHNINMVWRPLTKPEFGGHIERLIGTISKKMHILPGTTFSNVGERGTFPSEGTSSMTLEGLEKWFATYICDVYHQTKHGGLYGKTPLQRFTEGVLGSDQSIGFGFPEMVVPEQEESFLISMLPMVRRKIQAGGIFFECINWCTHDLQTLRVELGEDHEKQIVRYDPRAMQFVYVWREAGKHYLRVPYADTSHPSVSLWELRQAKAYCKQRGIQEPKEADMFEALLRMDYIVNNAKATTKMTRRNQQRKAENLKNNIHQVLEDRKIQTIACSASNDGLQSKNDHRALAELGSANQESLESKVIPLRSARQHTAYEID